MIKVKDQQFLECYAFKKAVGGCILPLSQTRERKGKGSRWPNNFLWRFCDHVDRFGRLPTAFVPIK